jgi:hypothetical protein
LKPSYSYNFSLEFLTFGILIGFIYSIGSLIPYIQNFIYLLLGISLLLYFWHNRISIDYLNIIIILISIFLLIWMFSLFFTVEKETIIWKIMVGVMWILFTLVICADINRDRVNKFNNLLVGFGAALFFINIVNMFLYGITFRMSFIGDPNAPHVFSSALVLTGSALITMSSTLNDNNNHIMRFLGMSLVLLAIFTLSKTAVLAILLLFVFTIRNYPVFSFLIILPAIILIIVYEVQLNIDFSRAMNFDLNDVSIGGRFELFFNSFVASVERFGLPGYIDYPKHWIDTSIGSMISSFGIIGTIFLSIVLITRIKKLQFGFFIFLLIFLSTEHYILPRILLPCYLLIYTILFSTSRNRSEKIFNYKSI